MHGARAIMIPKLNVTVNFKSDSLPEVREKGIQRGYFCFFQKRGYGRDQFADRAASFQSKSAA